VKLADYGTASTNPATLAAPVRAHHFTTRERRYCVRAPRVRMSARMRASLTRRTHSLSNLCPHAPPPHAQSRTSRLSSSCSAMLRCRASARMRGRWA
jgi:hypothetical protein